MALREYTVAGSLMSQSVDDHEEIDIHELGSSPGIRFCSILINIFINKSLPVKFTRLVFKQMRRLLSQSHLDLLVNWIMIDPHAR